LLHIRSYRCKLLPLFWYLSGTYGRATMQYPSDKLTDKGVKGLPLPPAVAKSKRDSTAVEFVEGRESRNPGSAKAFDAGPNGKDRRPPVQIDYFDPEQDPPGFGVRVSHKGARTWVFMYRYNGVKRRMKLASSGTSA
jgi:hypothetical protein